MIALLTFSLAAAEAAPQASKQRVAEIMSYVNARLDQQMDVWFDAGDYPVVINLLRVTTALRPGDYETWTNLGWMLENIQEWDAAVAVYKQYVAENPNDPDGALPLGTYYTLKRKYDLIPAVLEPSIHRSKHPHPNVYRILARAYERIGKLTDAQRVWKAYLAFAPNDGAAKNNLTRVEHKIANPAKKP